MVTTLNNPKQNMPTEMEINRRMDDIQSEFAQIPTIGHFDLEMKEVNFGDILITLTRRKDNGFFDVSERIIGYNEPLDFIAESFNYPNTITPRTCGSIAKFQLKSASFGRYGHLVLKHSDGSIEEFKCKKEHREEITSLLQARLGDKFKK